MKYSYNLIIKHLAFPYSIHKISQDLEKYAFELNSITKTENDHILDFSVPVNRIDCLSCYGVARLLSLKKKDYKSFNAYPINYIEEEGIILAYSYRDLTQIQLPEEIREILKEADLQSDNDREGFHQYIKYVYGCHFNLIEKISHLQLFDELYRMNNNWKEEGFICVIGSAKKNTELSEEALFQALYEIIQLLGVQVDSFYRYIKLTTKQIAINHSMIESILGRKLPIKQINKILIEKDYLIKESDYIIPPIYRYDISQEADIIEDIVQELGYQFFIDPLFSVTNTHTKNSINTNSYDWKRRLVYFGYNEVKNLPFLKDDCVEKLGLNNILKLNYKFKKIKIF